MRYIVGDVHGCYSELMSLIQMVNFDSKQDELWCIGDIVNRGPQPLEVLRYIKGLGVRGHVVLGNHDVHLLANVYADRPARKEDTLSMVHEASDCEELLDWLRHQPLLHCFAEEQMLLVHAGIPPQWTLEQAMQRANEVEAKLRSDGVGDLLANLLGSKPNVWDESLQGHDRYRYIFNGLARMRYCHPDGRLDFSCTKAPGEQPDDLQPWYTMPAALDPEWTVVFGHWASLMGKTGMKNRIALDTGCVYGGQLSMLCLENRQIVRVNQNDRSDR